MIFFSVNCQLSIVSMIELTVRPLTRSRGLNLIFDNLEEGIDALNPIVNPTHLNNQGD